MVGRIEHRQSMATMSPGGKADPPSKGRQYRRPGYIPNWPLRQRR